MSRTRIISAAVLVAVLAVGGIALAGGDDGSTSVALEATGDTTVYTVEGAGAVTLTFDGSAIALVDVHANPGWRASVDSETAREIEIDFLRGAERLRFNAEVEDGRVRVRVENRADAAVTTAPTTAATVTTTSTTAATATTAATTPTTAAPATAPTTVDDRGGSNSGPGHGGDDDNSGPGSGDGRTETFLGLSLGVRTVDVPGIGSITLEVGAGGLRYISAAGANGWQPVLDEAGPHEVEVEFHQGGSEVDAKLEIEDGSLRLRVERDD